MTGFISHRSSLSSSSHRYSWISRTIIAVLVINTVAITTTTNNSNNFLVALAQSDPTSEPTWEPTEDPATVEPTDDPATEEPTDDPATEEPTWEPTDDPATEEPTWEPTNEPSTSEPSSETVTGTPTTTGVIPTPSPSFSPSVSTNNEVTDSPNFNDDYPTYEPTTTPYPTSTPYPTFNESYPTFEPTTTPFPSFSEVDVTGDVSISMTNTAYDITDDIVLTITTENTIDANQFLWIGIEDAGFDVVGQDDNLLFWAPVCGIAECPITDSATITVIADEFTDFVDEGSYIVFLAKSFDLPYDILDTVEFTVGVEDNGGPTEAPSIAGSTPVSVTVPTTTTSVPTMSTINTPPTISPVATDTSAPTTTPTVVSEDDTATTPTISPSVAPQQVSTTTETPTNKPTDITESLKPSNLDTADNGGIAGVNDNNFSSAESLLNNSNHKSLIVSFAVGITSTLLLWTSVC